MIKKMNKDQRKIKTKLVKVSNIIDINYIYKFIMETNLNPLKYTNIYTNFIKPMNFLINIPVI